jgi:hypothetical protein
MMTCIDLWVYYEKSSVKTIIELTGEHAGGPIIGNMFNSTATKQSRIICRTEVTGYQILFQE